MTPEEKLQSYANKHTPRFFFVMHKKVLFKLIELHKNRYRIGGRAIPFPHIYQYCGSLGMMKEEAKQLLEDLQDAGIIEIIPFNGVKLIEEEELK